MLGGLAVFLMLVSYLAGVAQANEGNVALTGTDVACEGVSLWKSSNFRVTGRCDGLVYPYATQQDSYVLWARTETRGEIVRVSEIDRGYFDGNVPESFTDLYVTAESQGLPRRPSETQIASGTVTLFSFDKGQDAAVATPAPLAQPESESMTVQNGIAGTVAAGTTAGSVIGKILRSLLIIIAVVVVLVIGASLIFRRRGSVST